MVDGLGHAAVMTLYVTTWSYALGAVGAILLVLGRIGGRGLVRHACIAVTEAIRAVPVLVWIFLVFFGLAQVGVQLIAVTAAIAALSLVAASHIAEILRGGYAAVERGQLEACQALGLPRRIVFRSVLVPQVVRAVAPSLVNFYVGLLKDSALASLIGVPELVNVTHEGATRSNEPLDAFLVTGGIYLGLSLLIAALGRVWTRRRVAIPAAPSKPSGTAPATGVAS